MSQRRAPQQLALFSTDPSPSTSPSTASLRARRERAERLRASLPDTVFFGTSSWSFPGWQGLVYPAARTETQLARDGLIEYVQHPLLRTVGVDRGFYAPIPRDTLERYAAQVPVGFPLCFKVPERIVSPLLDRRARGGVTLNPDYLSNETFERLVLRDVSRVFGSSAGPFVLEFPTPPDSLRRAPGAFFERLDAFLAALPRTQRFAVELRERTFLTPEYAAVLARHSVGHVYNYWSAMPDLPAQACVVPIATAPFAVVRLLLRPGTRYSDRRSAFAPFDRLHDVDESMRASVVQLVMQAVAARRPAFVLVNNKAEGSSPLTIEALAERLATSLERSATARSE